MATNTKPCQFCGRELRIIGGWYSPQYESCTCGGIEREIQRSVRQNEELRRKTDEENRLGGCTCHDFSGAMNCPMHGSMNRARMSCR
jgi:hypothetical protein